MRPARSRTSRTSRTSALVIVVLAALAASCALSATDGSGSTTGLSGSIGSNCRCANSQTQCDAATGGCQAGLICYGAPSDNQSRQICTQPCPCPIGFSCKPLSDGLTTKLLCARN